MNGDWQSWAALAVVIATAAIMGYRTFLRKKTGCAGGCGCDSLKSTGKWKRDSARKPPAQ